MSWEVGHQSSSPHRLWQNARCRPNFWNFKHGPATRWQRKEVVCTFHSHSTALAELVKMEAKQERKQLYVP